MSDYSDPEACAFAAWCLQHVPRLARECAQRMSVGFECPQKYREVLVETFRSNCKSPNAFQHRVYLNHTIDTVTLEFTWPKGTLRVDYFTTI